MPHDSLYYIAGTTVVQTVAATNWKKYPRMAGIFRNMNMLVTATHLVAFWDGKSHGTKHMIEIAKEKGIPVWIYKY